MREIFNFGGNKSAIAEHARKLGELEISKHEYYMALKIALKDQLDVSFS